MKDPVSLVFFIEININQFVWCWGRNMKSELGHHHGCSPCRQQIALYEQSHNAFDKYTCMHQFVTEMGACKMVHSGVWVWCIVIFVQLVYWLCGKGRTFFRWEGSSSTCYIWYFSVEESLKMPISYDSYDYFGRGPWRPLWPDLLLLLGVSCLGWGTGWRT